ncbi:two-component system sensor histidine kinase NtrB [Desulfatirhabdium butyrativorans]|uniref:two-component system sensor histidine kinase NtrB n=1 Tax=Desulfatirhabdium butyrativorans TaxID=340467 RepID=UPI0003F57A31|nr:ATP-binding protein [Desulfatirhabdium butyrativorans]
MQSTLKPISHLKTGNPDERAKPFRLVKYFTIASLVVLLIGAILLSVLNIHWAKSLHMKKSEDYALALIENLNHQIFLQFVIPVVLKYGKIELSNPEQFERMDTIVRNTLHSFKVEMVTIYDISDIISYSFDKDLVGKRHLGGPGFEYALSGKPTSRQIQRGSLLKLPLGFAKESKLITFAPLRAERQFLRITGPVLGVIELTQDITEDYRSILKYQTLVISTCTIVMVVLLVIMILVVKRGEAIIQERNLEQIKLREKLAQAEKLSSVAGMVAGISHEIRNPLGIITSSAALLKKKADAQNPNNTFIDIIVEEANRLNDIITDFLNCARPRTPNLTPSIITELLEKNIGFLGSQLESKGIQVQTNFPDHIPPLLVDPDMLYQAFLNVLINAMDAMPQGGRIDIHVNVDEHRISILFLDQGVGIDPDIFGNIWDPFFTTKQKGTGLGLGIVKSIVEAHHGKVSIENRNDAQGAIVRIELPIEP